MEAVRLEGIIGLQGVEQAVSGLGKVGAAADKTQAGLDGIGKQSQKTSKEMAGLGSKINAASQSMQSAGSSMSRKITLPLVGMGIAATKVGADFDQTIRQMGSVAGVAGPELDKMRQKAIKLGQDTQFSAGQAADAMLELAKGGITPAQMEAGVLSQTLTLASAGGLQLGAAASYMTNTMNAFGISAGQAGTVAAALAGGANASTASVESLGMGLSQVSAQAKQSGMSMNETIAALAAFDQAGVKGSDAGTSLKTMLQRLNPQTEDAAAKMKQLGIDFTDAQGNFLPMADVAQELQDGLGKLGSESEKTAALTTIFGSDASRAAAILGGVGAEGVNKYTKATQDLGAAQRLAKTNTEGTKGSIEQMMGSLETAGIQIATVMAPSVTAAAGHIMSLANSFGQLDSGTQATIIGMAGVAAAIGPVMSIVGSSIQGFSMLASGVTMLGTGIGTMAMAAGTAIPALSSLALVVAANPLLTGAVAVAGIVGAGIAIATMGDSSKTLSAEAQAAASAVKSLDDAAKSLAGANVSQKEADISAKIAVKEHTAARQNLQRLQKSGKATADELAAATLAVQQAEARQDRTTQDAAKNREENNKAINKATKAVDENLRILDKETKIQKDATREKQQWAKYAKIGSVQAMEAEKATAGLNKTISESVGRSSAARGAIANAGKTIAGMGTSAQGAGGKIDGLNKKIASVPKKTQAEVAIKVTGLAAFASADARIKGWARTYTATLQTRDAGKAGKRAKGGIISGPGTGTSDSILSWVSNGEAVIPASSTAQNRQLLEYMIDNPGEAVLPRYAKGKKPKKGKSAAEKASDAWSGKQAKTGVTQSQSEAALARAESTASLADDIKILTQQKTEFEAEARGINKFIGSKSYKAMTRQDKSGVQGALASALRNAKSTGDKIAQLKAEQGQGAYDAEDLRREALGLESQTEEKRRNALNAERAKYGLAPLPPAGTGGSDAVVSGGVDQDLAAMVEQQRVRANNAAANLALSQRELAAFTSAGDMGYGGMNAYQAARGGGSTVIINSLSGYDPAIQQAIANTSNTGNSQGGNADIMYSGRVAV